MGLQPPWSVNIPLTFVYAWLRFRSGSVWPSTLAHAAANAQAGFALLILAPAGNSLLRPPYGVIDVVPIALLGLILVLTGRVNPAVGQTNAVAPGS
jgi:membrane protease YdiL (CAAX protease family)